MVDKHQTGKNKPKRNENGEVWRGLTRIANDKLEKFRLNVSRPCSNRDVAKLKKCVQNEIVLLWDTPFLCFPSRMTALANKTTFL